jgi:hypothetical protein
MIEEKGGFRQVNTSDKKGYALVSKDSKRAQILMNYTIWGKYYTK